MTGNNPIGRRGLYKCSRCRRVKKSCRFSDGGVCDRCKSSGNDAGCSGPLHSSQDRVDCADVVAKRDVEVIIGIYHRIIAAGYDYQEVVDFLYEYFQLD